MISRVFVDTDVILDLLLPRPAFLPEASRLFALIQNGQIEAFTSPLVFPICFTSLPRSSPAKARFKLCASSECCCGCCRSMQQMIDLALASSFKDFEDAVQYYAAISANLDTLVTRNKKDYRSARIPILTAAECVASYHSHSKRN